MLSIDRKRTLRASTLQPRTLLGWLVAAAWLAGCGAKGAARDGSDAGRDLVAARDVPPGVVPDYDAHPDRGTDLQAAPDTGTHTDATSDGAPDAPPGPPSGPIVFGGGACAHELTNPACWSGFGTGTLHPSGSFWGGAFDGRYVYLTSAVSAGANDITRYDTTADFGTPSSWSAFDLSSVNAATPSFYGSAFDGRYVYFPPCHPGFSSTLSRYDTQGAFGAAASWSNFEMAAINGVSPSNDGQCDAGAVFDGRYVYFVPNSIYEYWRGTVERYDTHGPFDALTSWTTFDTLSLSPYAAGFRGAAFDGRYIYFVPWGDLSVNFVIAVQGPPRITRFDTTLPFTDATSWSVFDSSLAGNTAAFIGAAFDGRYVYFPPGDARGQVTRYDTQAAFTAAAGWSVFNMNVLGAGMSTAFNGARFDGRYVYFIPGDHVLARYDTTAPFASATSWTRFDLTTLDARAVGYNGAVFDGRFLYLVPFGSSLLLRFDARAAGALPAHSNASFF